MRLHCFGESGNAYKAALALTLSGCDWTPVAVDFFAGAARSPDYARLNEMAEVPLLELDDGTRLSQSGVIQWWAADTTGALGPRTDAERYEILRWQFWDNHKLSGLAGPLRFLMNYLPEDRRAGQAQTIAWLSGRLEAACAVLDRRLTGRDWVATDRPTIADLSCCGYLHYPEPFGFDRAAWPAIDAWLDRIAALPGWVPPYALMPPARPENRSAAAG